MRLAEYDKMMEEKGTPKVWVVNSAFFGGSIYSALFLTEEEARERYDSIPCNCFREIYRTWDIWGWTERKAKGIK
jgi:hypothetical protein